MLGYDKPLNFPKIKPTYGGEVSVYAFPDAPGDSDVWLALEVNGGRMSASLTLAQADELIATLQAAAAAQRGKVLLQQAAQPA